MLGSGVCVSPDGGVRRWLGPGGEAPAPGGETGTAVARGFPQLFYSDLSGARQREAKKEGQEEKQEDEERPPRSLTSQLWLQRRWHREG